MKLSRGIDRFTVDLSLIGAIVVGDYQNRLIPNSITVKTKSGERLVYVEYEGSNSRDKDYISLLEQWHDTSDGEV